MSQRAGSLVKTVANWSEFVNFGDRAHTAHIIPRHQACQNIQHSIALYKQSAAQHFMLTVQRMNHSNMTLVKTCSQKQPIISSQ